MTQENEVKVPDDQGTAIKNLLFDAFYVHFDAMSKQVKKLPIAPLIMNHILFKFDDGLVWIKEAFTHMDFSNFTPQPPVSPASELKVIESAVTLDDLENSA